MNLYFSEVTELDTTQKRSFRAYIDSKPVSGPIIPPYGEVTEMSINFTASSNTSFLLFADPDSTLPSTLEGLSELQKAFSDVLQVFWSGDPCLPSPYTWEWITCSNDTIPRITALDLSSFNLTGELPDFSSMDALVTINLQNNSITGPIPDFLGALPNLKELNLADNSFSGPVPPSLSSNKKLKLVVSGNPDLCVSSKSCQTTSTDVLLPVQQFLQRKTAAIAAVTTGQTGGANRPGGANNMAGNTGGAVINEIKVNFHDQTTTENGDQENPRQ
ncbi:LRR receptor serine/threonine-protein kinase [Salix suchowensis]|nr:LRR receptor serine/threonine-protein kinase [Salix suchowensis]